MKLMRRFFLVFSFVVIAGCAVPPSTGSGDQSPRVQAPSSQGLVETDRRRRAKAHADLGFAYYTQGQYAPALEASKVALAADSSYVPAHNLRALVSMALGDQKTANDAFQRALQLAPGDPEIANNYGWFLCQTKREQLALSYFNQALQNPLYPTPILSLTNSGQCALQIGDYSGAESFLTRALALNPNDARGLQLMATLRFQQELYSDADAYLDRLHRAVEPTAATLWLALQVARKTGNRKEEARYISLLRKNHSGSDEYRQAMQGLTQ